MPPAAGVVLAGARPHQRRPYAAGGAAGHGRIVAAGAARRELTGGREPGPDTVGRPRCAGAVRGEPDNPTPVRRSRGLARAALRPGHRPDAAGRPRFRSGLLRGGAGHPARLDDRLGMAETLNSLANLAHARGDLEARASCTSKVGRSTARSATASTWSNTTWACWRRSRVISGRRASTSSPVLRPDAHSMTRRGSRCRWPSSAR